MRRLAAHKIAIPLTQTTEHVGVTAAGEKVVVIHGPHATYADTRTVRLLLGPTVVVEVCYVVESIAPRLIERLKDLGARIVEGS